MNNFKINLTKRLKPYSKYIPGINKAMMRSHFKCKKSSSVDSENLGSFSDEIFVFSEKWPNSGKYTKTFIYSLKF